MKREARALRSRRNLRLMWTGESVSFFGSQLTEFALPLIAVGILHVSTADVPFIAFSAGIGTILTLIVLAPLADHPARKRVMITVNAIRIGAVSALAVSLAMGQHAFAVMCVAAFVIAGCGGLYDSTFAGLVTEAVEPSGLQRANSWFSGMRSAGNIGAGGIGGILLNSLTASVVLFLDALTYVIAIVALLGVRPSANPSSSTRNRPGFTAGMRAVWQDPIQRVITVALAHFNVFTTAIQSILIVYAVRTLGLNALEIGAAMATGGLIGLSGVLLTGPVLRRLSFAQAFAAALAVPGLLAAGLWFVRAESTFFALVAIAGMMGAWSVAVIVNITATETYKQLTVDPGLIGRFSSAVRLVTWGVDPVGALLAAALLGALDLRATMLVLSAGLASSCLWILLSPAVRTLPRLDAIASQAESRRDRAAAR